MSSSEDELMQFPKVQTNDLQNERRKKKRMWVRKGIGRREQYGASSTLLKELVDEDPISYFNFLRINSDMFLWLLEKVVYFENYSSVEITNFFSIVLTVYHVLCLCKQIIPEIQKKSSSFRDPVPGECNTPFLGYWWLE